MQGARLPPRACVWLVSYAHQTGGHLVAEGVETADELLTLRQLGVDLVQGYYLGRPGWPWPGVEPVDELPGARQTVGVGNGALRAPRPRAATLPGAQD